MAAAGADATHLGADPERLAGIGEFIELHIEQGHLPTGGGAHGLTRAGSPLGLATGIWPHGRWRVDITGQQNHAGTTPLADRDDPMLGLADVILAVRAAAEAAGALATVGKVAVHPGAVNAIPGRASAWIDARAADEPGGAARDRRRREPHGDWWRWRSPGRRRRRSTPRWSTAWPSNSSPATGRELPRLPSGAGHDAGVLALAGIPSAMILVRNPTGISHAPEEFADDADCEAGVTALAAAIRARAGEHDRRRRESFWCEHAVLPAGGRTAHPASTTRRPYRVHRRRDHRRRNGCCRSRPATNASPGWSPPASPTSTRTPSTAPCAAAPTPTAASFWNWREQMYRIAALLDPDNYCALASAVFAEMALAGITLVGEFHYLHHGPDGSPYDDRTAMADAVLAAAAERRHPDHPARHALPARRTGRRGPAAAAVAASSADSATARRRVGAPHAGSPAARRRALVRRSTRVRAVDREPLPASPASSPAVRSTPTCPSSPPRTTQVPAAYGRTPTRLLADAGLLGPRLHRRARAPTSPTTTSRCSATAAARVCFCPTTERDLADGIGPAATGDAGAPLCLGTDQQCGHRPVRGAARPRNGPAARHRRSAAASRPTQLLRRPTANGLRGARLAGRRLDRARRSAPTSVDRPRPPRTRRRRASTSCWFAATAADVTTVVVGGHGRDRAPATARRRRRAARRGIAATVGADDQHSVDNIGAARHQRPDGRRPHRRADRTPRS